MSIEGRTLGKMSINRDRLCKALDSFSHPIPLVNINSNLRTIINCIQTVLKGTCYIYFPQKTGFDVCEKGYLYEVLNRSIIVYKENVAEEVKRMMMKFIDEHTYKLRSLSQLIIEFKSKDKSYRYAVLCLGLKQFAILTPITILKEIESIYNVIDVILNDITRYTNYENLRYVKIIIPLNSERLAVKYSCIFNRENLEVTVLNAMSILFYADRFATVCKHQA